MESIQKIVSFYQNEARRLPADGVLPAIAESVCPAIAAGVLVLDALLLHTPQAQRPVMLGLLVPNQSNEIKRRAVESGLMQSLLSLAKERRDDAGLASRNVPLAASEQVAMSKLLAPAFKPKSPSLETQSLQALRADLATTQQ